MSTRYLSLNDAALKTLGVLNHVHAGTKFTPFSLKGHDGWFLQHEVSVPGQVPDGFCRFCQTLPVVEIDYGEFDSNMDASNIAPTDEVWPEYLPVYGATEITLPDKLYHYTNAEGLVGIVSSNRLRASHFSFLNDKGEFDYCKRLIAELTTECSACDTAFDRFRGMLDELGSHINQTDAFIISLCGDGDSLHAWRAYGDGGRGYSIGLVAREIGLRVPPDRQEPGFSLLPVIYDKAQQQAILRPKVEQVLEHLKDRRATEPNTFPEYLALEELFGKCLTEIVSFKHPAFRGEEEYRIVVIRDPYPEPPSESL
jgi:hypothetical protein